MASAGYGAGSSSVVTTVTWRTRKPLPPTRPLTTRNVHCAGNPAHWAGATPAAIGPAGRAANEVHAQTL